MSAPLFELPAQPVQVMKTGNGLAPDVVQFLASEVALTVERERNRRFALIVLIPLSVVVVALLGTLFGGMLNNIVLASTSTGALVLFGGLGWGARNRALLDRAAGDAAVERAALVAAVARVRRGEGPSTALRLALEATNVGKKKAPEKGAVVELDGIEPTT